MDQIKLGSSDLTVSRIALGCMRMAKKSKEDAAAVLKAALDGGINFFDHADIYGGGESEMRFKEALTHLGVPRHRVFLQSKCGISDESYDFSYDYILHAVEGSLTRLGTDYLDVLLLHRPDVLLEPEEVSRAFADLKRSGKVRWFGVSNQTPAKMELTFSKVTVQSEPVANQLQISLAHADLFTRDVNMNRAEPFAADHSGYVLDYCHTKGITIQAWSPLQYGNMIGCFIGSPEYKELNEKLAELAEEYQTALETIAIAWLIRHPAGIQPVIGTMTPQRITNICRAAKIRLTRKQWYGLYKAGENLLP